MSGFTAADIMIRTIQADDIFKTSGNNYRSKIRGSKRIYEKYGFASSPSNELHLILSKSYVKLGAENGYFSLHAKTGKEIQDRN